MKQRIVDFVLKCVQEVHDRINSSDTAQIRMEKAITEIQTTVTEIQTTMFRMQKQVKESDSYIQNHFRTHIDQEDHTLADRQRIAFNELANFIRTMPIDREIRIYRGIDEAKNVTGCEIIMNKVSTYNPRGMHKASIPLIAAGGKSFLATAEEFLKTVKAKS